jgi:hypothetical protein
MAADPSVVAKPGSVWGEDFVLADRDLIRRTSAFALPRGGDFSTAGGETMMRGGEKRENLLLSGFCNPCLVRLCDLVLGCFGNKDG